MKKHQAVSSAVAAATETGGGGNFIFYSYRTYYVTSTNVSVDCMNAVSVML